MSSSWILQYDLLHQARESFSLFMPPGSYASRCTSPWHSLVRSIWVAISDNADTGDSG